MTVKLRKTLLLLSLLSLNCAGVNAETHYTDPEGQYRLPVPENWQIAPQRNGVSLIDGSAYASLWKVKGEGAPQGLVEAIAGKITSQWQGFEGANSGDCQFAGRPGFCAWFTGTNPKGVLSVLKMAGATEAGYGYVLFMSAPRSEFSGKKAQFEQIQNGFEIR